RAHSVFPLYGFNSHAGYGTAQHRAGIEAHGPCVLHRMTFRPLRRDPVVEQTLADVPGEP
ncbi:MAG: hypothetical protein ACK4N1_17255, partial [Pseudorhizobium sp.]